MPLTMRHWRRIPRGLLAAVVTCCALGLLPSAARADFSVIDFNGGVFNQDTTTYSQAGGHPYSAKVYFDIPSSAPPDGFFVTNEDMRNVGVDLPPGLIGNPLSTATRCATEQFLDSPPGLGFHTLCPDSSQVGIVMIRRAFAGFTTDVGGAVGLYNLVPSPGQPAALAFKNGNFVTYLIPRLRGSDYGISVETRGILQGFGVTGAEVTLWGNPADPAHDTERGRDRVVNDEYYCASPDKDCANPSGLPQGVEPKPFLTLPSNCSAGALTTGLRVDSWQNPGDVKTRSFSQDTNGNPTAVTGCDEVPFDPEISIAPTSTAPDNPTGLDVELSVPQAGLLKTDAIAQANLKRARVVLPEGMTISPAAADGLAACSDAQLALGSDGPAACPKGAKIGTVSIDTPLLDSPVEGGVYIRSQASGDPASGEMFRIAIVADNDLRGVHIKLPGSVAADPQTGRLVTTFDDNPQLPFSTLKLRLKDGPRAPLATPATCGVKQWSAELSPWSAVDPDNPTAEETVTRSGSFEIDCPGSQGFSPAFQAGTMDATAGAFSPFAVRIDRDDREHYLAGVSVDMPEGLLAKLRGVPLCGDAQAAGGGCPAGSRIGTATVGAGPGATPFYLQGPVYLTTGYKGGPYGLSVQVHVEAGPFDLGTVIVRQAIHVDPETAQLSVVSDPLPRIVKGVPVRLRSVNVDVDRPGFTVNPTSCARKQIEATLTSVGGIVRRTSSPFQVGGCRALAFTPRLAMRLTGRRQTKTGGHPGLRTVYAQPAGQANLDRARVTLPKSVVLDPNNSTDPRLVCGYDQGLKADCPASSVIGRATAHTPLLNEPLTGTVHLVQGIRFGPNGNRIRTLPTLLAKLRGEVAIDLRGRTSVDRRNRLVTTFASPPDAPVSRFALAVDGGREGILVVTRTARSRIDLCRGRQVAAVQTDGQNGRQADFRVGVKTPCKGSRRNRR